MEERFTWDIWEEGTPASTLRDARVALVGRIRDSLSRGTHSVMFVEIESIRIRDEAEALVYYERGFHRISELTAV